MINNEIYANQKCLKLLNKNYLFRRSHKIFNKKKK